jgi:hypothetical protein
MARLGFGSSGAGGGRMAFHDTWCCAPPVSLGARGAAVKIDVGTSGYSYKEWKGPFVAETRPVPRAEPARSGRQREVG